VQEPLYHCGQTERTKAHAANVGNFVRYLPLLVDFLIQFTSHDKIARRKTGEIAWQITTGIANKLEEKVTVVLKNY
jgi:hypothetical protein